MPTRLSLIGVMLVLPESLQLFPDLQNAQYAPSARTPRQRGCRAVCYAVRAATLMNPRPQRVHNVL